MAMIHRGEGGFRPPQETRRARAVVRWSGAGRSRGGWQGASGSNRFLMSEVFEARL